MRDLFTKDSGKMTESVEKVSRYGTMEKSMKDNGPKISSKEKVNMNGPTAHPTADDGETVKCTD